MQHKGHFSTVWRKEEGGAGEKFESHIKENRITLTDNREKIESLNSWFILYSPSSRIIFKLEKKKMENYDKGRDAKRGLGHLQYNQVFWVI